MAEVNHFYNESTTARTFAGSSWTVLPSTEGKILATDLAASTKYLIIAKAVLAGANNGDDYGVRIATGHDSNIATRSEMRIQPTYTAADEGKGYMFVGSFTTHATLEYTVQFEVYSWDGTTGVIDQLSLMVIDLDDLGGDSVGYADGSDGGIDDPDLEWTDDANVADGNESTYTYTPQNGTSATGYLSVNGSSVGTLGDIGTMRFRVKVAGSNSNTVAVGVQCYDGAAGLGTLNYTHNSGTTAAWSEWFDMATPSGGWTQAKMEALEARIWKNTGTAVDLRVYEVEYQNAPWVETWNATSDPLGTGAYTDILARIDAESLAADTEYLALGYSQIDVLDNKSNMHTRLFQYADANVTHTYASEEGEISDELRMFGYMGRVLTDATHSTTSDHLEIAAYADAASDWTKLYAYLIAIDVSAFDMPTTWYSFDSNGNTGLTATPAVLQSFSYVRPTDGNALVLGFVNYKTSGAEGRVSQELTYNSTSMLSGDIGTGQTQAWDPTDGEATYVMLRENITSDQTLGQEAAKNSGDPGGPVTEYEFLGIIPLELAPAAGPTYDETVRATTITSTITSTDIVGHDDTLRATTITSTITSTDVIAFKELLRATTIASTVASTDVMGWADLTRATTIASTIGLTDTLTMYELLRATTITSTITSTDVLGAVELLANTIASTITLTDVMGWADIERATVITSTITVGDFLDAVELLATTVVSTDTVLDVLDAVELVATVINSTITSSDVISYKELLLATVITSTDTVTDVLDAVELLANTIVSTIVLTDVQDYVTEVLATTVASTITLTDIQDYITEVLATTITSTITLTDVLDAVELLANTIISTITSSDVLDAVELLANTIISTITSSDVLDAVELLATTITSTVTSTDVYTPAGGPTYDETGRATVITSTITSTDTFTMYETDRATVITSTIASIDTFTMYETGRATVITSTIASIDTFTMYETGRATVITSTVNSTDVLSAVELAATTIVSTVTSSDVLTMFELLANTIISTVTLTDILDAVEALLATTIASTVDSLDAQGWADLEKATTIASTIVSLDVQGYAEIAEITISSTIQGVDIQDYVDLCPTDIISTINLSDFYFDVEQFDTTIVSIVTGFDTYYPVGYTPPELGKHLSRYWRSTSNGVRTDGRLVRG